MCFGAPLAALELPSGHSATLQEHLIELHDDGNLARFRYVMPALEGLSYADVSDDFLTICEGYALPVIADWDVEISQIVVSLSASVSEFGVADPDIRQFFEAFRPENTSCIWEDF